MKATYGGAESGPGATFDFEGDGNGGSGRLSIVDSRPSNEVRTRLQMVKPIAAEPRATAGCPRWTGAPNPRSGHLRSRTSPPDRSRRRHRSPSSPGPSGRTGPHRAWLRRWAISGRIVAAGALMLTLRCARNVRGLVPARTSTARTANPTPSRGSLSLWIYPGCVRPSGSVWGASARGSASPPPSARSHPARTAGAPRSRPPCRSGQDWGSA